MSKTAENKCIFCKIIAGELPADRVYEDEEAVAFLDLSPLFPGHVLVCPRKHAETLPDLPAATIAPLFGTVQLLSKAVQAAVEAEGTFVAMNNVVSQSVPHLHVHVVPRCRKDGLKGFFWPKNHYTSVAHKESVRQAIEREAQRFR